MRRIVVSEYLGDRHLARLGEGFEVIYDPVLWGDRARLLNLVVGAEAVLVRNRTRVDPQLIAAAERLRVVGRLGVGLDTIDLDACAGAGVLVFPAIGANAVSVAEYVMGAALVLMRGVFGMTASVVSGEWPTPGQPRGRELMGKTLGLIGFGAIGREVAKRAEVFGMRVIAADPYLDDHDPAWGTVESVGLDRLLEESDVVSIHTPLDGTTRNLIDEHSLGRMKPGAILINAARGGIVDEHAVERALRQGSLGGVALDVFSSEPLGAEAAGRFAGIDNLLLTPHVAGNAAEAADRVAAMVVKAVRGALAGSPQQ